MNDEWLLDATGHSAVGRQALDVDWEATPLGSPAPWPEGLRHAVRLCFSTRFPVLVAWGPDLTLIYSWFQNARCVWPVQCDRVGQDASS